MTFILNCMVLFKFSFIKKAEPIIANFRNAIFEGTGIWIKLESGLFPFFLFYVSLFAPSKSTKQFGRYAEQR